jgi:hypothetical protein
MIAITVFNLLMLPFAFLYALAHKCCLFFRKRDSESGLEVVLFALCGVFFLLLAIVPDAVKYFKQAYATDVIRVQENKYPHKFSYRSFEYFREVVDKARVQQKKNACNLVEEINTKFGVNTNIK